MYLLNSYTIFYRYNSKKSNDFLEEEEEEEEEASL